MLDFNYEKNSEIWWQNELFFVHEGLDLRPSLITPCTICKQWGVNIDKITKEEFNQLFDMHEFQRALWIAARESVKLAAE